MKVNLKKAAALAAALTATQVRVDHALAVDVYADPPTDDIVKHHHDRLKQQIDVGLALSAAAFCIRNLIGKANEGRINDLLTSRALIDKQLAFLNGIPLRPQGTNIVALAREIEAKQAGGNVERIYGVRGPTLELETETLLLPVQRLLRRAKREHDDELQALNFNTTIELPAEVVKVLTDLDLV